MRSEGVTDSKKFVLHFTQTMKSSQSLLIPIKEQDMETNYLGLLWFCYRN